MKGTPIGFMETDEERARPMLVGRYLWPSRKGGNQLAPDPTRSVCLNCTAYPESCDQSDIDLSQMARLEQAGELHCLLAYAKLHRLTTIQTGEAGDATLARGSSAAAYKRYVKQIRERNELRQRT